MYQQPMKWAACSLREWPSVKSCQPIGASSKLLLLLTYRISSNLYIGQVVYTKWRMQNAYSGTGRRLKELAPRVRRACGYLYSASCREGYL